MSFRAGAIICSIWICALAWLCPALSVAETDVIPSGTNQQGESVLFGDIPSAHDASKFEQQDRISGASRFKQKEMEAPSSITIITSSDVKKYGYRTLADALQSVPGFFTMTDRNYSYAGVRGFSRPGDYNTRVLILVDGHRINDNIYEQAPLGSEFPIDIDLIDRIEVVRGPSSSLYGTSAFLAAINIITKRGRDLKGGEASGEAGSFNTYKGRMSYGNRFRNGSELLMSGSYADSGGQDLFFKEFVSARNRDGMARGIDGSSVYNFFSKYTIKDLTLEGVYQSREKDIPTAPWGTVFNEPGTKTIDDRAYLDMRYDRRFDQWGVEAHLYYDHYTYTGKYMYDYSERNDGLSLVRNKDYSVGDWLGGDLQIKRKLFENHQCILGMEFRQNVRMDQKNYDEQPYYRYLDDHRTGYNWAAYFQDEVRFGKKWILNAGIRYDYYDTFGGTINPRVGLIYLPTDKTAFKLLYGTAFRAPNAYELYYGEGYSALANPDLDPEKIQTYELVWEQYLTENLRLGLSGYYYNIDDLITQKYSPDGLLVFGNIDRVEAKGMEIKLEGQWPKEIETRISYALQNATLGDQGKELTDSPMHLAKFNITAPLYRDKLYAGLEFQYTSSTKTLNGNDAKDSFIVNATLLSRNIVKGLELSASIYNLFDQDYGVPGSLEHVQDIIRQDGRAFRVKLVYSF